MGKQRKNPVSDKQIIDAYDAHRSAYKVAAVLGVGDATVYRVLLKHGVVRTGLRDYRKNITRFQGQENEIKEWYDAGETLTEIKRRLGGASDYSVKHAIKRAGGELRPNPIPTIKPGELETIQRLHASGMGQAGISLEINRSQSFVSRAMRANGIERHKSNGGGKFLTHEGYVRAWIPASDPLASMRNNTGHVLEHRLVVARALGRVLHRTESVHHINGNRADNRVENLQLRQGRHGKGTVLCCLHCGSRNIGPVPIEES